MNGYSFWNSTSIRMILAIFGVGIGIWAGCTYRQLVDSKTFYTPAGEVHTEAVVISPQGVHINVLLADSEKTRVDGLSNFIGLKNKQGMLFVFPQVGIYSFWMKDMKFPLDIIWIDKNGVIVDRVINVLPESYPKTVVPSMPVDRVLELPAHTADKYGFSVGSSIEIQNNK